MTLHNVQNSSGATRRQLSGQFHQKFFQQLTFSEKLCSLNELRRFQCLYSYILISTNEIMRKL